MKFQDAVTITKLVAKKSAKPVGIFALGVIIGKLFLGKKPT